MAVKFNMPEFAITDPQYQREAVRGVAQTLKPQYEEAVRQSRQRMANRGMLGSGADLYGQAQMGQGYTDALARTGIQAGMRSADIGEENRRRVEDRGWSVADQIRRAEFQKEMDRTNYERQREARAHMEDQAWKAYAANFIGDLIGQAMGGMMGGGGEGGPSFSGENTTVSGANFGF